MKTKAETLSPREREILLLLMNGLDPQEIADKLKCSKATVKTHIRHLHAKLKVSTTAKAVAWGIRHGLHKKL